MRSLLVFLMFLMLAFAGCTDPDDGDGTSMDGGGGGTEPDSNDDDPTDGNVTDGEVDNETGENPEPEPKRDPVTWDISIEGNDFVDGSITVQVGDTVRWTHNHGTTPHTVTSEDGQTEDFDSHPDCITLASVGCMTDGDTFEWTFDVVGTTDYLCKVHTSMTDTITVLERHDAVPA